MKNKKTFVGIALLIVVLVLGIAYATTTINLTITGNASANFSAANYQVAFTGETSQSGAGTIVPSAALKDTEATLQVSGLTTKDEVATATFKVKNYSSELASNIAVTAVNTDTEYFNVEATLDKASLEKDEEATVTVTVTLLKTPVSEVKTTIDVDLTATAKVAGNTVNN